MDEIKSEVGYQVRSRYLLYCSLLTSAVALMSSWNLVGRANSLYAQFLRTVEESGQQGITLDAALAQPLSVQEQGPGELLIDNVLRYDFETSASAVHNLGPTAFATNFLQLATFVAVPAFAFILGCSVLSRDARMAVLKARVIRVGALRLHSTQAVVTVLVALGSVLVGLVVAMVSGLAFRQVQLQVDDARILDAPAAGIPLSELAASLGLAALVTAYFALVGAAFGVALRHVLIPAIAFAVWNTAVPMLGPWDPRVPWASLGQRVFDFQGSFQLSVPFSLGTTASAAYLCLLAAIVGLGAFALARRKSLYA
ncbi:MAG: hypothetical protein ABIQ61_11370 [Ornithinibacter sp.]